jgi:hypothetical protein
LLWLYGWRRHRFLCLRPSLLVHLTYVAHT